MTRKQAAAVLHLGVALEERLEEIALDRQRDERKRARYPEPDSDRRNRAGVTRGTGERNERERVDGDSCERAVDPLPRLARAHLGRELVPSERAAGEVS